MDVIDFTTEEYAKLLLRGYGAWRKYDRVVILEDAQATGPRLVHALLNLSRTHRVDLLLLVHGHEERLVGHRGHQLVEADTFQALAAARRADPAALDLRMVFGLNCYGATLAPTWLALGARVCNGAAGVNWLPEPSLSVFLRGWLGGLSYGEAVRRSHTAARTWGARVWRPKPGGAEHPKLASSRQAIFGVADITIDAP
jgi:hypothetical protein